MNILTWNIQATKGCDDVFDASRIIDNINAFGDLDVICLQEVARHIPSLNSDDQPSRFCNEFNAYTPTWAPGFSMPDEHGNRCEFGNLTLVKKPLFKNSRTHILPSPRIDALQIPRTMAEVVIQTNYFDVAIFNTHLAFHSRLERVAQLQNLNRLRDQIIGKASSGNIDIATGPYLYTDNTQAVLLCGDLNVASDTDDFDENITQQNWVDCWHAQSEVADQLKSTRQPTCGCFDHVQWPEGPHIRDYFLATGNIANNTKQVSVDVQTDASDHQPVLLEIDL